MRFSESWKMAASASLRISSAASDLIGGFGDGGRGDMDQSTQDCFVADNLDVVFDRRAVRHAIEQAEET